jgi:hypothetical protein
MSSSPSPISVNGLTWSCRNSSMSSLHPRYLVKKSSASFTRGPFFTTMPPSSPFIGVWYCCYPRCPEWCHSPIARFRDVPEELRQQLDHRNQSASSTLGQGRRSPPFIAGESPGWGTPKMSSSPSPISVNGRAVELLHANSSSSLARTTIHAHEKAKRKENRVRRSFRSHRAPFFRFWAHLLELLEKAFGRSIYIVAIEPPHTKSSLRITKRLSLG